MKRILLPLSILTALLATPAGAEETPVNQTAPTELTTPGSNNSLRPPVSTASPDLRTWSISNTEEVIDRIMHPRNLIKGVVDCRVGRPPVLIPLSRSTGSGFVAVIAFKRQESNGRCELNPRGFYGANFDYGPIPPLADITAVEADQLWNGGSTKPIAGNSRTYKLVSREGAAYYLDLVFDKDRLQKYKIRGPGLEWDEWETVQKE